MFQLDHHTDKIVKKNKKREAHLRDCVHAATTQQRIVNGAMRHPDIPNHSQLANSTMLHETQVIVSLLVERLVTGLGA